MPSPRFEIVDAVHIDQKRRPRLVVDVVGDVVVELLVMPVTVESPAVGESRVMSLPQQKAPYASAITRRTASRYFGPSRPGDVA